MKTFITICLLLLSFKLSSADIKVNYDVVNYQDELSRRADIILLCKSSCKSYINQEKDEKIKIPYKVKIKRNENNVDLTLNLKSDEFTIKQPLLDNQTLSKVEIETLDNVHIKKFSGNILKLKFNSNDTIEIKYSIFLNGTKKVLLPEVFKTKRINYETKNKPVVNKFILSIFFQKGSISLDKKAEFLLKNLSKVIKNQKCDISITGYSDSTPLRVDSPFSSNEEIAQKRALMVKNFLQRLLKGE